MAAPRGTQRRWRPLAYRSTVWARRFLHSRPYPHPVPQPNSHPQTPLPNPHRSLPKPLLPLNPCPIRCHLQLRSGQRGPRYSRDSLGSSRSLLALRLERRSMQDRGPGPGLGRRSGGKRNRRGRPGLKPRRMVGWSRRPRRRPGLWPRGRGARSEARSRDQVTPWPESGRRPGPGHRPRPRRRLESEYRPGSRRLPGSRTELRLRPALIQAAVSSRRQEHRRRPGRRLR